MAAKKKPAGNGKARVLLLLMGLVAVTCAFVVFVPRVQLPAPLRDNRLVEKTYRFKDALLSSPGDEAPADPEKKQLGYPKDDRKKLDNLIGTEAKQETKEETEQK